MDIDGRQLCRISIQSSDWQSIIDSKTDQGFKLIAIENERSMWLQVNQKQVGVGSNIKF